jgi:hypothetical protein
MKDLTNASPPSLRPSDFPDESSYEDWKYHESKAISELVVNMIQANPKLAKLEPMEILPSLLSDSASERPDLRRTTSDQHHGQSRQASEAGQPTIARSSRPDIRRRISMTDDLDEFTQKHAYTFLPEDPRAYYKRLVEIVLKSDRTHDEEEGELLSEASRELLEECAFRWRVHPASQTSFLFEVVKQMYDDEELDIDHIEQAFSMADNWDSSSWPIADVNHSSGIY